MYLHFLYYIFYALLSLSVHFEQSYYHVYLWYTWKLLFNFILYFVSRYDSIYRHYIILCDTSVRGNPLARESRVFSILFRSNTLSRLLLGLSHSIQPFPEDWKTLQQVRAQTLHFTPFLFCLTFLLDVEYFSWFLSKDSGTEAKQKRVFFFEMVTFYLTLDQVTGVILF